MNDIEYVPIAALNQYAYCSPKRSRANGSCWGEFIDNFLCASCSKDKIDRIGGEMPHDNEMFFA